MTFEQSRKRPNSTFPERLCPTLGSRRGSETGKRVAVEGVGPPGVLIPWPILVADDRDRHDYAPAAHLIGGVNAVFETTVGANREFDRPRQLLIAQQLELILAGVLAKIEGLAEAERFSLVLAQHGLELT